jgi:hypothetical protein
VGVTHKVLAAHGITLLSLYEASGKTYDPRLPSLFEERVLYALLDLGFDLIDIEPQKTFDDLKGASGTHPLRYDFYIKSLNVLLEADGRQHREEVSMWGGFATTQRHDKMKNAYALKNGIELVRIPYKPTFTEVAKSVKGKLAPLIGNGQSKPL